MFTLRSTRFWSRPRGLMRKLGGAAFLFFFVKGMAWLALPWVLLRMGWISG